MAYRKFKKRFSEFNKKNKLMSERGKEKWGGASVCTYSTHTHINIRTHIHKYTHLHSYTYIHTQSKTKDRDK